MNRRMLHTAWFTRASILAVFLAGGLHAAPARQEGDARADSSSRRAEEPSALELELGARIRGAARSEAVSLAQALANLGPGAMSPLFDALRLRLVWHRADANVPAERQPLGRRELQAVMDAIGLLPRPGLLRELERRLAAGPSALERMTAMSLLGEHGEPRDLALLTRLACPIAGEVAMPRAIEQLFEPSARRLVLRGPASVESVRAAFNAVTSPAIRLSLIEVLGQFGSAELLPALADGLGRDEPTDLGIVIAIAEIAPGIRVMPEGRIRERVRRVLATDNASLLRETLVCIAALDDPDSVADVLPLLEHVDVGVRSAACETLRRTTGQRHTASYAEWAAWWRAEDQWMREVEPERIQQLASPDPAVVARAILDVTRRRLHRERLIGPLAGVLARPEIELVRYAAAALGSYESHAAIPDLEQLLDHPDPIVVEQARRSIERIVFKTRPTPL